MKLLAFLSFLSIVLVLVASYEPSFSEIKKENMMVAQSPAPCKDYDVITAVHSCKEGFRCEVSLRSGQKIKIKAPVIGEVIPCQKN